MKQGTQSSETTWRDGVGREVGKGVQEKGDIYMPMHSMYGKNHYKKPL